MISYAQNFEDVILRRCFRGQKNGLYVDIGAMDPVEHSVTKSFYEEGWSGINVEPNAFFHSKLLADRPRDINLNVAVGDVEEVRHLHVFERLGLSTFADEHLERFASSGYVPEDRPVRVTTLAAICREHVRREIDFLKIDCEGWEEFALRGADWSRFRPVVVLVEATEPLSATPAWPRWEQLLTEADRYRMVYFDGLNRFYLRREYSDLKRHFEVPPNVFDEFTPFAAIQSSSTCERANREKDELLERLSHIEKHNAALDAELAQARVQLSQGETQLSRERERTAEVQRQMADLEAESNRKQRQIEALQLEIEGAHREGADLELRLGKWQTAAEELDCLLKDVRQKLIRARVWGGELSQRVAALNAPPHPL